MGGFGGILRGLTTAATGAEQGLANRAELERQARMQLLAERLQEAQIQKRQTPVTKNIDPNSPTGIAAYQKKHPPKPAGPGKTTGKSVVQQETRMNAANALAALDNADAILKQDDEADIYPAGAAGAEGLSHLPFGIGASLKGFSSTLEQSQLSPSQKLYQEAMDQFLHNYSAVMSKGGRSVTILQNLRNSFTPRAGQTEKSVREGFRRARAGLRRQLQALANGEDPGPLPGGELSAAPVAPPTTGGAPTTPGYNPKFWAAH